ncbi:aspartate--tRNA(Asn) ligase [Candidatus Roizmanbacteria bacterium RIFCSPHIGHO2_01_FULL_39_24]|uniref:Aspartate--tRNA(Asn) ligase n=1 Tax=Candidatus Roizmanbacteria bacterium RIFCSPHIGHO2_01_FULL_39_24 TaxID=1802032 RepID=A0A1F7GLY7_9BACT|nr:MAG: aspartate--tRNA(Asn) ligase [Candidatus Roizmanbacteria bacterium RIFCSPHIGHO2_01_FULL_39_24]
MKKLFIEEIVSKVGDEVQVCGWVNTIRDHKKVVFVDLRDRSGIVQIVGESSLSSLAPEDVVCITGVVKERPAHMINEKVKTGKIEIECAEYKVLSKAQTLPFDFGKEELDVTLPVLLDYRALTLRHPKVRSIFLVQEAVMAGFRKAAQELGCVEVFVPTISFSSTEGGAEVFNVDYYDYKAFLIQSPQLYKQIMVPVFERVYLISHAYRAEPSMTTRHLSEATQLDCEFGFIEFDELLDALEEVGKKTLEHVSKMHPEIFEQFNVVPPKLSAKVPRLTLREAQEIIFERTDRDNRHEPDLEPEDEKEISIWALETHASDLVTITHFPTEKRAFYSKPNPKDPTYSLSYDLLFRGIEILSGSQRIDDYQELVDILKKKGMNPDDFHMYLQAFKYGMPPHGGFSFGLERITMKLLNLSNVREASLFPRDMERVDVHLPTFNHGHSRKEKK